MYGQSRRDSGLAAGRIVAAKISNGVHVSFVLAWLMTEIMINFIVNVYTFYNHAVLYDESINKYDSMLMRVIQSNGYLGTV